MDQDDDAFGEFEVDLEQVLGDLSDALRNLVKNVRKSRARRRKPTAKPMPVPKHTRKVTRKMKAARAWKLERNHCRYAAILDKHPLRQAGQAVEQTGVAQ